MEGRRVRLRVVETLMLSWRYGEALEEAGQRCVVGNVSQSHYGFALQDRAP